MPSTTLRVIQFPASSAKQSSSACVRPFLLRYRLNGNRCENAYSIESQRDAHACALVMRGVAVTLTYAHARGAA